MTSVYAASSIHSKSTLSKKYDVDTSAMWNGGEQFRIRIDDDMESTSFINFMQQFSLDVGRFNEIPALVNTLRMLIFPFFLILDSCGLLLVENTQSGVFMSIINVLKRLTAFLYSGTDINVSVAVNVSILLLYIAFVYSLVVNIYQYKLGSTPSKTSIIMWLTISRVIAPMLSSYVAYYFSVNLCNIIIDYSTNALIDLIISIPLLLIQIFYLFFSCSVYNATPIIRANDSSQLWFSHSIHDWQLNFDIFIIVALESILTFVKSPIKESIFAGVVIILSVYLTVDTYLFLPYIRPKSNAIIISASISTIPFSLFPLINNQVPSAGALYFIACIAFVIIAYIIAKLLINRQIYNIIDQFNLMRSEEEDNEDDTRMDPLSAAIMHLNKTRNNDFYKLGISGESKISLYLRIGFLFNVPEVEDQTFIKWCTDQTIKADVLLSACQVSYALQSDMRMLNNLEQYVNKLSSGPYNSKSFAILFDHLRQELLTQLNTPLLSAIQQAKKSDFALQTACSEFWNATLKQKLTNMEAALPQISLEMMKTDGLLQRLLRNYPRSPTVLRETVISYHKSLGDHHRSLELQAKLNRTRKEGALDSDHSSSSELDGIDRNFQDQMDPWIIAQDLIAGIHSPAKVWVITTSVVTVIIMFLIPIVELSVALTKVQNYLAKTDPVKVVGLLQEAISRLPQLIRRITLIEQNEITIDMESIGQIIGTLTEFANVSNAKLYIDNYIDILEDNLNSFLTTCSDSDVLGTICTEKSVTLKTDSKESTNSTLYDALSTFLLYAREQRNTNDYSDTKTSENVKFLFDNFDAIEEQLTTTLETINVDVLGYQNYFNKICIIFYIVTFVVPLFILVPLIVITYIIVYKEMRFAMKLFLSIPKTDISNLKWSAKSKKDKIVKQKDVIADDTSIESLQLKQEELYENLATNPKNHSGFFFNWLLCLIIFIVASCGFSALGIAVFSLSTDSLVEMTDNYIYSIQASTSAVSCYVWAQEVFSTNPIKDDKAEMKKQSKKYVNNFIEIFNTLLYGKGDQSMKPALLLGSDIVSMYVQSSSVDQLQLAKPIYGIIHDVYYSMSCETQVRLLDGIVSWLFDEDSQLSFSYSDLFSYHIEHIIFAHIQPYLEKGKEMFNEKVNTLNQTKTNQLLIVYVVLIVLQLIFIFCFLSEGVSIIIHHINTPKILLSLVPPESITKSPTIMKLLGGSITTSITTILTHGKEVMNGESVEFACDYSNCAVALLNEFLQVTRSNAAFKKLSKTKEADAPIRTVLQKMLIDNNKLANIQRLEKTAKKMSHGVSKDARFTFESRTAGSNGEMLTLKISLYGYSGSEEEEDYGHSISVATSFAIVIENTTAQKLQEELIKFEHEKIQKLIRLIMPDEIKGKRDIGFDTSILAETATIIVASIKTSITNEEIIPVVNSIFNEFDKAMNEETIKVRTCSLSYIAASGIFSKSKATGQSASDVALKMIENAKRAIGEERDDVSISIGLCTGTVKCGMVGGSDQVFDVVGETAQSAMRLSEICPPWLIHISERTYGEIKFLKYNLKEIGNGMHTYLLSPTPFSQSLSPKGERVNAASVHSGPTTQTTPLVVPQSNSPTTTAPTLSTTTTSNTPSKTATKPPPAAKMSKSSSKETLA